ncbi:MAG: NYN domain-containing protein [Anaerolineales bacterium]|nr:MAG: NYN domain-containing protein [Anaerolineales bacterium]
MPYLIDGHNLIPKLGLRLESMDDEMELAALLQEFARLKRKQVEVYFDGAPAPHAGTRKLGTVRAHFIRRGQTADAAIRARLVTMGKSARNWIVVSSDREVQSAARANQAQFISSEEFAKLLKTILASAPQTSPEDKNLSAQEVDEWLRLFRGKGN